MKTSVLSPTTLLKNEGVLKHLQKVTPENLPVFEQIIKNSKKGVCGIVCTSPTPPVLTGNPYEIYYCGGYNLNDLEHKNKAISTLNGLLSLPENVGNVLCQIV